MRDEADCCQLTMNGSSIKYIEWNKRGEGPGHPLDSKEERIKDTELDARRCRRISKKIIKYPGKNEVFAEPMEILNKCMEVLIQNILVTKKGN